MYGSAPDDMSGSIAPAYAPGTYEPPSKVGVSADEADVQPQAGATAEPHYEYRGGRNPITGRARTQM